MAVIPIQQLDDQRLRPYRHLRDRELAQQGGYFIAEGRTVVERLLASDVPTRSVLLARKRADAFAPHVPDHVDTYVVPDDLIHEIMGFQFHAGIIACGQRPADRTLAHLVASLDAKAPARPATLLVCPKVIDHENLGSLIRIASGFGVDGVLVGERSVDPYWRRSVRVSMGTLFHLPVVCSADLRADLLALRQEHGFTLVASVCDSDAPALASCRRLAEPDRIALLVGAEDHGLEPYWLRIVQEKVTIPMQLGTDSLNIAVAAAVMLYHYTQVAGSSRSRDEG